jgi:S1-C subfamily serine protease
MMSDTPRTDALIYRKTTIYMQRHELLDLALALERELAEKTRLLSESDVALIKIDAENLPTLSFANSDELKVGEWVVAVGNPFNLESTVTAGIISAIGRSINILEGKAPIVSFIQTDAVVNPGNSGGALVNTQGDLIGINTAIASPTGVFAGYSFAVPSNIVAKIVTDLREHGTVQRGYLGAIIRGIDGRYAQEMKLPVNEGVYIDSVLADGAAALASSHSRTLFRASSQSSHFSIARCSQARCLWRTAREVPRLPAKMARRLSRAPSFRLPP